jgi:hypothetical protein
MVLQNTILYLFILIFIIFYTIINYDKKDIIIRFLLLLFFGYFITNILYISSINYYKIFINTFFFLFVGLPLFISIIINLFLKYDLLYLFSIVFLIQWIIFLNVNPCSLKYNNKYEIMKAIPKKYRPNQEYLLSYINIENIKFPIIIKPIICSGCCNGTYIIKNKNEYINILSKINKNQYMMQELLEDYNIELKILYEKYPLDKEGKIINIIKTIKNKFNLDLELYWNIEYKFRKDVSYLITTELNQEFNKVIFSL